jgi:excisionase family DNA binding protein
MAKPRTVTDMQIWMLETGRTDVSLAAELTAKLQGPGYSMLRSREIAARTVARWRKGLMLPRYPLHLAVLTELSGGRVTANSFVEASVKASPAGIWPSASCATTDSLTSSQQVFAMSQSQALVLDTPLVVSPNQAMKALMVSRATLYGLINGGELASYTEGRSRRITVESINAYVQRRLAQEAKRRGSAT